VSSLLLERFPALARIPRVALVERRTPIEESTLVDNLWIKREDLAADLLGGNKVRALEFLLGAVRPGDVVLTVGATGSTHALATIRYSQRMGAEPEVTRWRQEMNPCAARVGELIVAEAARVRDSLNPVTAYLSVALRWAQLRTSRKGVPIHWVPAGGSSPLGALGHVEAALELADQVARGEVPEPARVVVALGSGGTAAGLALGLTIAGLRTRVVAVRVVPRVVGNRRRVTRLIRSTAALIGRISGAALPRPAVDVVSVDHRLYGGAYGRETRAGREASERFARAHPSGGVEPTYTAKALAAALALADGEPTVFWSTFDARCLRESAEAGRGLAGSAAG
jgi:1-aminocyclopropane-1-carboxylate deaminase/D-cysteine desulfhydrase-like pyridoxal-dependent ACC family enzyme